jgi:hypothetical protein
MKKNLIFLATRLLSLAVLMAIFLFIGDCLFEMVMHAPMESTILFIKFCAGLCFDAIVFVTMFIVMHDVATRNYKQNKPIKL